MVSKISVILVLCICLGAGLLIAGCTQQASTSGPATIANPASVNCVNLSGTVEIKTSADGGQYGMCTFKNGTTCEEWALFRGEGCKAGASVNQTGIANPASVNCVNLGGKVEIKDSAAGQYGMCTFANNTTCEEWALFHGEGCKAANVTA